MKRNLLPVGERQSRELLLQDFAQWKAATGSTSSKDFAQVRDLDHGYLIIVLKWHYEACKRKAVKVATGKVCDRPDATPSLVAVTNKAAKTQPAPSAGKESAIHIRMKASSIDIAGDIAPTLLAQLLSTLGTLNVL